MLQILLLILKIIGIILAVLLGLILLILCIVLFVPICYQGKASFEGNIDSAKARGEVTWFFKLVGVTVQFRERKLKWKVRVATKTILMSGRSFDNVFSKDPETSKEEAELLESLERELDEELNKKQENGGNDFNEEHVNSSTQNEEITKEDKKASEPEKVAEAFEKPAGLEETSKRPEEVPRIEKVPQEAKEAEKTDEKIQKVTASSKETTGFKGNEALSGKLQEIGEKTEDASGSGAEDSRRQEEQSRKSLSSLGRKIAEIWNKILKTGKGICARIKSLSEKKHKVTDFLVDENHKLAWKKAKTEVFKFIGRIWPKKIRGDLIYGFEDPSITGRVLAALSFIYPFTKNDLKVRPDFEHPVICGKLLFCGRIYLFSLVGFLWNLFWCKAVRQTYKDIREFEL